MKTICGLDRLSFFLSQMPWLLELWIEAATVPFYILFLLKINKRTVPALTCPYNYRHRMMTILFLLQAWHGYRFTFTQGRSAFLADAASLASFSPKMSSCRKSVFSGLPWPTICVWFRTLFLESFFELRFNLCFFILNGNSCFLKKEDCLKKTALENQFLRILIDKLGPYMC